MDNTFINRYYIITYTFPLIPAQLMHILSWLAHKRKRKTEWIFYVADLFSVSVVVFFTASPLFFLSSARINPQSVKMARIVGLLAMTAYLPERIGFRCPSTDGPTIARCISSKWDLRVYREIFIDFLTMPMADGKLWTNFLHSQIWLLFVGKMKFLLPNSGVVKSYKTKNVSIWARFLFACMCPIFRHIIRLCLYSVYIGIYPNDRK